MGAKLSTEQLSETKPLRNGADQVAFQNEAERILASDGWKCQWTKGNGDSGSVKRIQGRLGPLVKAS
eukprot:scaffold1399_cov410-Prasinococcus_capsulatus_cf.AAC.14